MPANFIFHPFVCNSEREQCISMVMKSTTWIKNERKNVSLCNPEKLRERSNSQLRYSTINAICWGPRKTHTLGTKKAMTTNEKYVLKLEKK